MLRHCGRPLADAERDRGASPLFRRAIQKGVLWSETSTTCEQWIVQWFAALADIGFESLRRNAQGELRGEDHR